MPKFTREYVYKIITREGEHAKKWDIERSKFPDSLMDADKPVEQWLYWIEAYLDKAKAAVLGGYDKTEALHNLRKALSLGVNCAMYHGLPERK